MVCPFRVGRSAIVFGRSRRGRVLYYLQDLVYVTPGAVEYGIRMVAHGSTHCTFNTGYGIRIRDTNGGSNRTGGWLVSGGCGQQVDDIRCRTWSAALWLPDAKGRPGTPYRDDKNVIGFVRPDGTPHPATVEGNLETEYASECAIAMDSHAGFFMVETPTRRKPIPKIGTCFLSYGRFPRVSSTSHLKSRQNSAESRNWVLLIMRDLPD